MCASDAGIVIVALRTVFSRMRIVTLFIPLLLLLAPRLVAQEEDADARAASTARGNAWHVCVDDNGHGDFFVVWSERGDDATRLRACFLRRGQREHVQVFDISDPGEGVEDVRPSVAWLDEHSVLLAWQRNEASHRRVWLARVDRDGEATEAVLLDDHPTNTMAPVLQRDAHGVLALWQDFRNGNFDVYCRRLDAQGLPRGEAWRVNDDSTRALQGVPRASRDNGDDVLAVWSDNRVDQAWKFYYTTIDAQGVARNALLDSAQRKAMTTLASAVWISVDSAAVFWKDYREGHSNIYRRLVSVRDGCLSPARRINDDTGEQWQRLPVTDSDGRGHVLCCWEDYRNAPGNQRGDVYAQVFARDGAPLGGNLRINDREDRIARKVPALSMDVDGYALILWHQGEGGRFRIMGQWLRYPGERVGANFCVSCGEDEEDDGG